MKLVDEDTEKEIHDKLPDLVKAVEEVKRNKIDYLMMMLDAFTFVRIIEVKDLTNKEGTCLIPIQIQP